MPFRLRNEAGKTFFKHISDRFPLDFDMYYFCLMAGLAARRKDEASASHTTEIVDHYPGEYRTKGRAIVALFLSRELDAMGISRSDRRALNAAIGQLVDPLSPTHLSEAGLRELNKYSSGGLAVLMEWFDEEPRIFEAFLPLYKRKLDEAIGQAAASSSS